MVHTKRTESLCMHVPTESVTQPICLLNEYSYRFFQSSLRKNVMSLATFTRKGNLRTDSGWEHITHDACHFRLHTTLPGIVSQRDSSKLTPNTTCFQRQPKLTPTTFIYHWVSVLCDLTELDSTLHERCRTPLCVQYISSAVTHEENNEFITNVTLFCLRKILPLVNENLFTCTIISPYGKIIRPR